MTPRRTPGEGARALGIAAALTSVQSARSRSSRRRLEAALEGLRDSVHRQAILHGAQIPTRVGRVSDAWPGTRA
jgi:hypothetical protein